MRKYLVLFIILASNTVFGQNNVDFSEKRFKHDLTGFSLALENIKQGDEFYLIGKGAYFKALPFYLKANDFNANNSELNFKIAMCYLFSDDELNAIKYFNLSKNLQAKDKTTVNYYLGLSYQKKYQAEKAIEKYNEFLDEIPFFKRGKWKEITEKRIFECENAILFQNNAQNNTIENLGNKINTEFSEQNPIFLNEQNLLFSSRKKSGNIAPNQIDSVDFQYYEDVFVLADNNIVPFDYKDKYPNHDAIISLKNDTSILYLSENGGDLYLFVNGEKTILPKQINSPYHESSAVFSNDGNTIYFTSNKKKDNYDIYYSQKNKKGKWKHAKRLSKNINTKYDEKSLFLHPNGKVLFFASNGHNSMGGYDIFYSTKQDDNEWSEPKNLGCPINSPDDDMFFTLAQNEEFAYFASNRKEGFGKMDIYKTTVENVFHNFLKIIVKNEKGEFVDADINILSKNDQLAIINDETVNGMYQIPLNSENQYILIVNSKNYMFYSQEFEIESDRNETVIEIVLKKAQANKQVVITNIEFDYTSANLKSSSYEYLDQMALFLITNPNQKIEISGHTDNTGNYDDNQILSENRAKSVVDYLVSKGVSQNQLIAKGYSSDKPIADNDTPEGREKNRRVEFKIIK